MLDQARVGGNKAGSIYILFYVGGMGGLQAHGLGGFNGFCYVFYTAIDDKLNQ